MHKYIKSTWNTMIGLFIMSILNSNKWIMTWISLMIIKVTDLQIPIQFQLKGSLPNQQISKFIVSTREKLSNPISFRRGPAVKESKRIKGAFRIFLCWVKNENWNIWPNWRRYQLLLGRWIKTFGTRNSWMYPVQRKALKRKMENQ